MYFEIVKIVRLDFSEYQAKVWNEKNKMQLITKPHFEYEPVGDCWKTENGIIPNVTNLVVQMTCSRNYLSVDQPSLDIRLWIRW